MRVCTLSKLKKQIRNLPGLIEFLRKFIKHKFSAIVRQQVFLKSKACDQKALEASVLLFPDITAHISFKIELFSLAGY